MKRDEKTRGRFSGISFFSQLIVGVTEIKYDAELKVVIYS